MTPATTTRAWRGLGLSASAIGLLLVIDQLLLPMFHIAGMPIKPSYLLVGMWAVDQLLKPSHAAMSDWQRRHLTAVGAVLGLIGGCALLGGLYFEVRYGAADLGLTAKNITMLVLAALSFGVGIMATRFEMRWLIYVLAASIALNLSFIILRGRMPGWLVETYFPPMAVDRFARFGVIDATDLLALGRPVGITSNPNGSALMINIIALFIYCGYRLRLIPRPGTLIAAMIIFMPMALSMLLASRGEFLSAAIVGVLNFRLLFGAAGLSWKFRMSVLSGMLLLGATFAVSRLGVGESMLQNIERVAGILRVLDQAQLAREGQDVETGTVARPLLTAKEAGKRFLISPLIGSGYASTAGPPFEHGTDYFHNDWFWLAATSGLVGLTAMLWFVVRYCVPLSPVLVLPFLLPGMVNTFMLNIPVMMFFFFMIGVLMVQLRVRTRASAPNA